MDTKACAACGKSIAGYKCDTCGMDMEQVDPKHICGAEHVFPKCAACSLVETACTCV